MFVKETDKLYRLLLRKSESEVTFFSRVYKEIANMEEDFNMKKIRLNSSYCRTPLSHLEINIFMGEARSLC